MTREEALERYDRIRYSLLNAEDKEAVDVAFDALATSLQQESSDQQVTNHLRHNGLDGFGASLATENQVASDWISVKDWLPEPFISVLGYCPDEEPLPTVHECYLNGFGQWMSAQVYGMGNVTHWMPLPEPPEEEVI